MRDQRVVESRQAEQHRRAVALDRGEHRFGIGPPGEQHGRRARRERKRQRVAEAVGEEDLRRREHDVVLADAEHASCRSSRTCSAGSCCRCTTPFGRPVEPELYIQNAISSRCVSAHSSVAPTARRATVPTRRAVTGGPRSRVRRRRRPPRAAAGSRARPRARAAPRSARRTIAASAPQSCEKIARPARPATAC